MRSFEQSLERLNISKIDVCLIHDVDTWTHGDEMEVHFKTAMNGAYKALKKLKDENFKNRDDIVKNIINDQLSFIQNPLYQPGDVLKNNEFVKNLPFLPQK